MIGSTETITKEVNMIGNKNKHKYTCFSLWDKENKKYINLQLTQTELLRATKRAEQDKKPKSIVRFFYKVFHAISSIF